LYGQHQASEKAETDRHTLTIRVTPSLHQSIDQIARAEGETVAAVVRRMLRDGVEQRGELVSR
jgi:predicted HicB family RNase H-like nuclease